jgi:hypothetical protein
MSGFQEREEAKAELKASLAKREFRQMAQSATAYINASVERYNRSAGQSRRQWNIKRIKK